jgi:predicted  nucleic acid-binding Zn-ribbon protein
MPKNTKPEATEPKATESTEPKRKVLTAEERVAKLEAELAAARKKAEAKANKAIDELQAKRKTLVEQIEERQTKVRAIDTQLEALGVDTTAPVVEGKPELHAVNEG